MAKRIARVTDLTKLEGDPLPAKADLENPRMHLEWHARGPRQIGFVRFIARCSENAPVARAIVVAILVFTGVIAATGLHFALPGAIPVWASAGVTVLAAIAPSFLYIWITRPPRQ